MKLFWEHKIEGEKIEFDNTPFIISKIQNWIVSLAHIIVNKNKDHPSGHIYKAPEK